MPSSEIGELRRDGDAGGLSEVERDQACDVADGESAAGDKSPVAQDVVENRHVAQRPRAIGRRPVGDLRLLELRRMRVRVAENLGDRQEEMPLDAPLPHLNRRPFERRRAEQVRLRTQFLDIAADRDRFPPSYARVWSDSPRSAVSTGPSRPGKCARAAGSAQNWNCRASTIPPTARPQTLINSWAIILRPHDSSSGLVNDLESIIERVLRCVPGG